MAQNLLARHLPMGEEQVSTLLNRTSFVNVNGGTDSSKKFIARRVEEINDLIQKTTASEKAFYKRLKVSNLYEFNEKLKEINEDKAIKLLTNGESSFDSLVNEMSGQQPAIKYETKNKSTNEEEQVIETWAYLYLNDDANILQSVDDLVDEMNRGISNSSSGSSKKQSVRKFKGNYGLKKQIVEVKVSKSKKKQKEGKTRYIVKVANGEIDQRWVNRLKDSLSNVEPEFETIGTDPIEILKKRLMACPNTKIQQEIINEIGRNYNNKNKLYDLNKSDSSIKGFLGEVRNNAIINYFANGPIAVPTGNIRKYANTTAGGSEEIPIDTIIKDCIVSCGFQVKNYKEVKGTITLGHKQNDNMKISNFLRGRVRTPNADILEQLFASYHYNIDATGQFSLREQLEKRATTEMVGYFDSYIDNIIRLSDYFQSTTENPFFGTQQLYYNTFFVVGKKYIPASIILTSLKQQILKQDDALITSFYDIQDTGALPIYPQEADNKFDEALNQVSIQYKITLNTKALFDRALDIAEAQTQSLN